MSMWKRASSKLKSTVLSSSFILLSLLVFVPVSAENVKSRSVHSISIPGANNGNSHHYSALIHSTQYFEKQQQAFSSPKTRFLDEDHDEHHQEHHDERKPWGKVFGTTLLINMATLSGVILLVPAARRSLFPSSTPLVEDVSHVKRQRLISLAIPSFASGALLATAIFLILPESLLYIQNRGSLIGSTEGYHEGEEDHGFEFSSPTIAIFGCALIGGFMIPSVFGIIFPHTEEDLGITSEVINKTATGTKRHCEGDTGCMEEDSTPQSSSTDVGDKGNDDGIIDDIEADTDTKVLSNTPINEQRPINYRLFASILIGDAFHNFCDGVFVGVAYLLCSDTTAITIVLITFYHEVAQEIADFFLLTKHVGLSVTQALLSNFVAGLPVIFGGLLILGVNVNELSVGVILSIACGVYLQIAASECLPRVDAIVENRTERFISLCFFILGAVPIGLTLLKHEHCDGGHEEH